MSPIESKLIATPQIDKDGQQATLSFNDDTPSIYWKLLPHEGSSPLRFDANLTADFALLAALPLALGLGRDLHINGQVCPMLLANAEKIMRFRALWNPKHAKLIKITADQIKITNSYDPNGPHIMTLSGGVDSTHALAANFAKPADALQRNVTAGLMVRGFDYPTGESEGFSYVETRIRALCAVHDLDPVFIETNWRQAAEHCHAHWGTYHILALSAVMHLLQGPYQGGLFAADFTYLEDANLLFWGSNSITNSMVASAQFQLEPRGAETSRPAKVKTIYESGLMEHVSVCWAGPRTGGNCGECTKCRRTMLMAVAQDLDPLIAFPRRPTVRDVLTLPANSPVARAYAKTLAENWTTQNEPLLKTVLLLRKISQPLEISVWGTVSFITLFPKRFRRMAGILKRLFRKTPIQ